METFPALLALCAGNSPATGEFPSHRPVTQSFDGSFSCALNKRLYNQSWDWWFETPSRSLWRHCNVAPTGARKSVGHISHLETLLIFPAKEIRRWHQICILQTSAQRIMGITPALWRTLWAAFIALSVYRREVSVLQKNEETFSLRITGPLRGESPDHQ